MMKKLFEEVQQLTEAQMKLPFNSFTNWRDTALAHGYLLQGGAYHNGNWWAELDVGTGGWGARVGQWDNEEEKGWLLPGRIKKGQV